MKKYIVFVLALLLNTATARAGTITKSHTFTAGGTASASQVNTNFDEIYAELNAKETRISALEGGGTISPWTIGASLTYYANDVGIGTTAPSYRLDVRGGDSRFLRESTYSIVYNDVYSSTAAEAPFFITRRGRGTLAAPSFALSGDRLGGISFRGHSVAAGTQISSFATQNHSGTSLGANLRFYTVADNAASSTERMRIDQDGKVLIGDGASSAESLLDVRGMLSAGNSTTGINNPYAVAVFRSGGNPHLIMEKSGVNVGGLAADSGNMVMASELGDVTFRTNVDYNDDFTATGYERMRIRNDGTVGIGTSSPGSRLHVNEPDDDSVSIQLSNNTGASSRLSLEQSVLRLYYPDSVELYAAGSSRMFVNSSGNVGIGLTNPTYQLQLSTDSAAKTGTSAWTIASDERLKEIRAPFTRGLDAITGLNTIYFSYKKGNPLNLSSEKEYVGIKAQDAQRVIPEAVSADEQGYLHVTNDSIIWTAVNAIKELYGKFLGHDREIASIKAEKADRAEIVALRVKNQKLEQENAEIKARLERIEKMLETK